MKLRNRRNGLIYYVQTEDDSHGGFCIFARSIPDRKRDSFVMHYRTLAEFNEEWEDD